MKKEHCSYHIVWCPVFEIREEKDLLTQSLLKICDQYHYQIRALKINSDYIHLFVDAPPTVAPYDIMKMLRSISVVELLKEFPELKRFYMEHGTLWSKGYFLSTAEALSEATIMEFVKEQKGDWIL